MINTSRSSTKMLVCAWNWGWALRSSNTKESGRRMVVRADSLIRSDSPRTQENAAEETAGSLELDSSVLHAASVACVARRFLSQIRGDTTRGKQE